MGRFYVTFYKGQTHILSGTAITSESVAVWDANSWADGYETALKLFKGEFKDTFYDVEWDPNFLRYYPFGLIDLNSIIKNRVLTKNY